MISMELERVLSEVRQLEIAKDYWKKKYFDLYALYTRQSEHIRQLEEKIVENKIST